MSENSHISLEAWTLLDAAGKHVQTALAVVQGTKEWASYQEAINNQKALAGYFKVPNHLIDARGDIELVSGNFDPNQRDFQELRNKRVDWDDPNLDLPKIEHPVSPEESMLQIPEDMHASPEPAATDLSS